MALLSGLALGRVVRETGLGSFLADLALPPLLRPRTVVSARAAVAVVTPLIAKRFGRERATYPTPPFSGLVEPPSVRPGHSRTRAACVAGERR